MFQNFDIEGVFRNGGERSTTEQFSPTVTEKLRGRAPKAEQAIERGFCSIVLLCFSKKHGPLQRLPKGKPD